MTDQTTVSGSDAGRQDEQPDSFHRALSTTQAVQGLDADARDAARYRWLCLMAWGVPREAGWHELTFRSFGVKQWSGTTKEVADAAIDAAMSHATPGATT